jgi:hypothetical protein
VNQVSCWHGNAIIAMLAVWSLAGTCTCHPACWDTKIETVVVGFDGLLLPPRFHLAEVLTGSTSRH